MQNVSRQTRLVSRGLSWPVAYVDSHNATFGEYGVLRAGYGGRGCSTAQVQHRAHTPRSYGRTRCWTFYRCWAFSRRVCRDLYAHQICWYT